MTEVFKLTDGTNTIDLLAGTAGWQLEFDGFEAEPASFDGTYQDNPFAMGQKLVSGQYTNVTESFRLKLSYNTHTSMANAIIALERMLNRANIFWTNRWTTPGIYLQSNLASESSSTYRHIVRGVLHKPPDVHNSGLYPSSSAIKTITGFVLEIERLPGVRGQLPGTYDDEMLLLTGTNALGGIWDYTHGDSYGADIAGSMPAIMSGISIQNFSDVYFPMDRLIISLRTASVHPNLNLFNPVWDLHKGTEGADSSGTADAAANSGTAVVCNFGTVTTSAARASIKMSEALGTTDGIYAANRGDFRVYGRMKCDSGTITPSVLLKWGWYTAAAPDFEANDAVSVSGTVYKMYDLGMVRLPPTAVEHNYWGQETAKEDHAMLQVFAALSSGTGSLFMDCLVLMPTDEGILDVTEIGATNNELWKVAVSAEWGEVTGNLLYNETGVAWRWQRAATFKCSIREIPQGDGRLIFLGMRDGDEQNKADTVIPQMAVTYQYHDVRGTY